MNANRPSSAALLLVVGALQAGGATAQSSQAPLRDSVTTLPAGEKSAPVPEFTNTESRLAYLRWLDAMSVRMQPRIEDAVLRRQLLQTVWYEARRAGLNQALVLGMMDTLSGLRKFHVAPNGAVGYMSVNPSWAARIGDGDISKLMHTQTNLRFGCVVFRHYLDNTGGDVHAALRKYVAENLGLVDSNPVVLANVNKIHDATGRWSWVDGARQGDSPKKR